MPTRRETLTTLVDFHDRSFDEYSEPTSIVRRKANLSGGMTMWQARLVLSTLEPKSKNAEELRSAIRRGDMERADALLEAVYSHRVDGPHRQTSPSSGPKSVMLTTLLPPCPQFRKLEVG